MGPWCTGTLSGGVLGERVLINNKPQAASTRGTSKTPVCFHMTQEVFKIVMVQARDKLDLRSVIENDVAEGACLLSHAPFFFSLVRQPCLTSSTYEPV